MASPEYLGESGSLVEQASAQQWERNGGGWSLVRTWKGNRALRDAKINELFSDSFVTNIQVNNGVDFSISATYKGVDASGNPTSGPYDPDDEAERKADRTWTIQWNTVEKKLISHQIWATMQGVDQALYSLVEKDIAEGNWTVDYDSSGTNKWNAYRNLRLAGTEVYLRKYPVVRKVLRSPLAGAVAANFNDTMKVVNWADFKPPALTRFPEPKYWDWVPSNALASNGAWASVSFEYLTIPTDVSYDEASETFTITSEWQGVPKIHNAYLGGNSGGWCGLLYNQGTGTPIIFDGGTITL